MSSRNNANINKIARLSYVIIFSLLSYYIFLENIYGNNSVYDKVQNVVHKSITNHWYKRCSTTSRKSDCKGYHVKILISGQWMEAKNESVYQYRARAKFNKERGVLEEQMSFEGNIDEEIIGIQNQLVM